MLFSKKKTQKIPLTKEAALLKLQSYCAYQERCHQEVVQRLRDLWVKPDDVDQIVAQLIEDNFLNEERFAIMYALGKFRIKQFGNVRIRLDLQQKQVSAYSVQKALAAVAAVGGYVETLQTILKAKYADCDPSDPQRLKKTADYALRRGFESTLVWDELRALTAK